VVIDRGGERGQHGVIACTVSTMEKVDEPLRTGQQSEIIKLRQRCEGLPYSFAFGEIVIGSGVWTDMVHDG
jgi:hypothetical protein